MCMKHVTISKVHFTGVRNALTQYPGKQWPYINTIMGLKFLKINLCQLSATLLNIWTTISYNSIFLEPSPRNIKYAKKFFFKKHTLII